jgi:hypothetical protein
MNIFNMMYVIWIIFKFEFFNMNFSVTNVFQIEHFPNSNKIWKKIDLNVFQRKNNNKKIKRKNCRMKTLPQLTQKERGRGWSELSSHVGRDIRPPNDYVACPQRVWWATGKISWTDLYAYPHFLFLYKYELNKNKIYK